ncbi:hypothetical protein C7B61_21025 [filamentous cyanobacterium CCP1]|nr:hypothetical protein C7B76_03620 [filamentous cyanobacterium CCP2]PSB55838.1 hypothetical protein C7B61_21025 [filamentous cyanobacterium CCP1]
MSSGHASHKGPGIKQSHDTGQIDSAATTPASDPQEILDESEGYPFNAQGTEINPAATERPNSPPDQPNPEQQDGQQ